MEQYHFLVRQYYVNLHLQIIVTSIRLLTLHIYNLSLNLHPCVNRSLQEDLTHRVPVYKGRPVRFPTHIFLSILSIAWNAIFNIITELLDCLFYCADINNCTQLFVLHVSMT